MYIINLIALHWWHNKTFFFRTTMYFVQIYLPSLNVVFGYNIVPKGKCLNNVDTVHLKLLILLLHKKQHIQCISPPYHHAEQNSLYCCDSWEGEGMMVWDGMKNTLKGFLHKTSEMISDCVMRCYVMGARRLNIKSSGAPLTDDDAV